MTHKEYAQTRRPDVRVVASKVHADSRTRWTVYLGERAVGVQHETPQRAWMDIADRIRTNRT